MSTNVLPVLTHVSVVNIQERQKLVLVGIRELCRTDYFRAKQHFRMACCQKTETKEISLDGS